MPQHWIRLLNLNSYFKLLANEAEEAQKKVREAHLSLFRAEMKQREIENTMYTEACNEFGKERVDAIFKLYNQQENDRHHIQRN